MYKTLLILIIAIGFSSCTEDMNQGTTGTLQIVFKARYNDAPLVLFENHTTGLSDPSSILFKRLDFFISKIKGTSKEGLTSDFAEVGYISMAQSLDQASSEAGTSFTIEDIPIGVYEELNLGIGLPDAMNNTTPGGYESSSPLALNANYWSQWSSYILCKLEGSVTKADTNLTHFLLHSGVNGMYQQRSFAKNYKIIAGQTTQIIIYINAEDFMFKTGSEIDILNENQTHSGEIGSTDYLLAKKTIENIAVALSI